MRFLFLILISFPLLASCSHEEKIFARNVSPSGKYSIEIYAFYPKAKKGVVRLVDNETKEVLRYKKVDSVRFDLSVINWSERTVWMNCFATWDLPKGGAGKESQHVKYVYDLNH